MAPVSSQHLTGASPTRLPYDMLALVNERLFNPSPKEKPCNLHNYFLGYREHMETPPSPTHTDTDSSPYQDEYYSVANEVQSSQSSASTLIDSAPTTIPSPALSDLDPSSSDDEGHDQYRQDQHSFKRGIINQTSALLTLSRPHRSVANRKARQGNLSIAHTYSSTRNSINKSTFGGIRKTRIMSRRSHHMKTRSITQSLPQGNAHAGSRSGRKGLR